MTAETMEVAKFEKISKNLKTTRQVSEEELERQAERRTSMDRGEEGETSGSSEPLCGGRERQVSGGLTQRLEHKGLGGQNRCVM